MDVREWALIIFTILAQMSVGAFIVLGVVHYFAQRQGGRSPSRSTLRSRVARDLPRAGSRLARLAPAPGQPDQRLQSRRQPGHVVALPRNLVRCVVCGRRLRLRRDAVAQDRPLPCGISWRWSRRQSASCSSTAWRWCMLCPTRPSWNLVTTPISFFVTTLLLGVLAMGAAFVANYWYVQRKNPGCASDQCVLLRDSLKWIAVASIVLLGCQFVIVPLALTLAAASGASASVGLMAGEFGVVFVLRLVLVFLGAGVLGIFVYRAAQQPGQEKVLGMLAYAAFALVLVGEVLGRFLFYATAGHFGLQ